MRAVAISGSPSPDSTSRLLADRVLELLAERDFATELIDLSALPADALLGRAEDEAVVGALAAIDGASVLVLATPVYRATYTALLKTVFDLMPQAALAGKVSVLIATGYGAGHLLSIDHGLRPLVASLDGLSAATGIYATSDGVVDGKPVPELDARLSQAANEAAAIAAGLSAGE
jgi:FMN reductase